MSRHVKSLSSDLHAIKKWKYQKTSFHSKYYLILSVFSSFNRLVKSKIEIFKISRSDHNTYRIISQQQNEITHTRHNTHSVLCTGLRGKWPSNSLDVPWPAGEGGTIERCWGRRGTSIHTPIIREKVTWARRRCGEREEDSLENRCATIDRSASAAHWIIIYVPRVDDRADLIAPITVCPGWGQLRWVTG